MTYPDKTLLQPQRRDHFRAGGDKRNDTRRRLLHEHVIKDYGSCVKCRCGPRRNVNEFSISKVSAGKVGWHAELNFTAMFTLSRREPGLLMKLFLAGQWCDTSESLEVRSPYDQS